MTRDSSRDEPKIGSQSVPDGNCLHFQLFGSAPKTKSRVYELENGLYSAMPVSDSESMRLLCALIITHIPHFHAFSRVRTRAGIVVRGIGCSVNEASPLFNFLDRTRLIDVTVIDHIF